MRRSPGWLLMAATVLAACPGPPGPATPSATRRPAAGSPSPKASPAGAATARPAGPSATPAASESGGPAPFARLTKPATGTRTLSGRLAIDATYAINAGGAQIVSNNGSSAIALGGAGIIGKIRGPSGIISDGGGSLISDAGGQLLSNNGGSLIANHGAGLVAQGAAAGYAFAQALATPFAAAYGLAQAPTATPAAAGADLGAMIPAAGMLVSVLDLRTNAVLALGSDAAGKPVYTALTDAEGRFTLFPPAAQTGNVVLHARAPAGVDPRLRYNLLVPATPLTDQLDEDSSIATYFIHRVLARSFRNLTDPTPTPDDEVVYFNEDPAEIATIVAGRKRLKAAGGEAGIPALPTAVQAALADRLADMMVAKVDPTRAQLYKRPSLGYEGPDERAFDAYLAVLKAFREAVTARMREVARRGEDPFAYFAARDYVQAAAARRGEASVFKKPVDVVEFVIEANLADPAVPTSQGVVGLVAAADDFGTDGTLSLRFAAAMLGTNRLNAQDLYLSDGALLEAMIAVVRATGAAGAVPPARP